MELYKTIKDAYNKLPDKAKTAIKIGSMVSLIPILFNCGKEEVKPVNKEQIIKKYDARVDSLIEARDRLEDVTTKYMKALKSGELVSNYGDSLDGLKAFKDLVILLGYEGAENIGEKYDSAASKVVKDIETKHELELTGIPGKEISSSLIKEANQYIHILMRDINNYKRQ